MSNLPFKGAVSLLENTNLDLAVVQIAGIALPAGNAVRQRAKSPCDGRSVSYMFQMRFQWVYSAHPYRKHPQATG